MISYDPDTAEINKICNEFIGCKIQIGFSITFLNGEQDSGEIENCNIVGDIMEDILYKRISDKIPTFQNGPKQSSPDFYNRNKMWEWELKCFKGSPCFDISNFNSYISQLQDNLERKLYKTKYLVFKYKFESNSIELTAFKLCNVWEMIQYNGKNPISVQTKKGIWYNIRPCSFNDMNNQLKNPDVFIKHICKAINQTPNKLENKERIVEDIQREYYKLQYEKILNDITTLNVH